MSSLLPRYTFIPLSLSFSLTWLDLITWLRHYGLCGFHSKSAGKRRDYEDTSELYNYHVWYEIIPRTIIKVNLNETFPFSVYDM